MPASTYHSGATSATIQVRTGTTSSPYELDEDELIDLRFNDDATQPYLSLGLTPLSQLDNYSPDDTIDSGSERLGFFPSMPPPVSHMNSVFTINNAGIPVDSPFNISHKDPKSLAPSSGVMVMPDAIPTASSTSRRSSSGGGRRGKVDITPLSQGYAIKLETVPEQSGSLDSNYSDTLQGRYNRHPGMINGIGGASSSSGSAEDHSNEFEQLIFPSADTSTSIGLQRQKGLRNKSGTRRSADQTNSQDSAWDQSSQGRGLIIQNREIEEDDFDLPVKLDRFGSLGSSREEGIYIRAKAREQAREQELARQKELRQRTLMEDDRKKRLLQDQRARRIANDYGSTRARDAGAEMFANPNYEQGHLGNSVIREAMKFEAQIQATHKDPASRKDIRDSRRPSVEREADNVVHKYDQFTTL